MSRPAAPRNHDRIEPHAFGLKSGPLRQIKLRRAFDTRLLPWAQRNGRCLAFFPRLDLDEADDARRRTRDEIDFTRMRAHAAAKNAIEFTYQKDCSERFAVPTAPLGLTP